MHSHQPGPQKVFFFAVQFEKLEDPCPDCTLHCSETMYRTSVSSTESPSRSAAPEFAAMLNTTVEHIRCTFLNILCKVLSIFIERLFVTHACLRVFRRENVITVSVFFSSLNEYTTTQNPGKSFPDLLGAFLEAMLVLPPRAKATTYLVTSGQTQAKQPMYLSTTHVLVHRAEVYETHSLSFSAGDVGGQLGLFIGASFITCIEVVMYLIKKIARFCVHIK